MLMSTGYLNETDVLCFSGGPDSLIAWFFLDQPTPVYQSLGHKYEHKEIIAIEKLEVLMHKYWKGREPLKDLLPIVKVEARLYLGDLEKQNAEIPLRNTLIALLASEAKPNVHTIWMVFQKGETINESNDRSKEFCFLTSKLLSYLNNRNIIVNSPFWDTTKGQMVQWFMTKYKDPEILKATTSCYSEEDGQCG